MDFLVFDEADGPCALNAELIVMVKPIKGGKASAVYMKGAPRPLNFNVPFDDFLVGLVPDLEPPRATQTSCVGTIQSHEPQ